jgi:protein-S-isoprenylcysteine O-methyltransferase Ste14
LKVPSQGEVLVAGTLAAKFPTYGDYRSRVRRLIPFVY